MLKKFSFSTPKITSKLIYNTFVFFPKKNLNNSTFTPPILNFIALPFQNSFSFGSSSYQKKYWSFKNNNLKFFYWTGTISYLQ